MRKMTLRLRFPGIEFAGRVHISPGCDVYVGHRGRLRIASCHIARGVTLTAAEDAELHIEADFIGPYSTLVARKSVRVGKGSKVAERVTVRDANHDHSVPLRDGRFTTGPIQIGADVWIGAGATVLAGASIGDGATVGAGAIVTRDVEAGETVVGVPARPVSGRPAQPLS